MKTLSQDTLRKVYEFRMVYGLKAIAMVRECVQCKKLFIPESGHYRTCSQECRDEAQAQFKRDWWTRNGNEWRAARKKAGL